MERRPFSEGSSGSTWSIVSKFVWIVLGLVFIYGVYQAISLAWVCDDAFISFRYAKNLIQGHGLVFNVGEQVEGYTNFLWTIMIAGGMLIGLAPILLTQVIGIISFICVAVLFSFLSLRLAQHLNKQATLFLPLTATALLVHHDFQVYATSGMETTFTTALVSLGFTFLLLADRRRSYLMAGLVLCLAVLTRPDAVIFHIAAIPFIIISSPKKIFNTILYLLPTIVVYLPYWLIRYDYYRYPFPNTYYAKSAYLPYYQQGLVYLWLFAKTYYALFLFPVAILVAVIMLSRTIAKSEKMLSLPQRALLLAVLFSLPFIIYVMHIGGGFMFARLLIPALPFVLFLIEAVMPRLIESRFLRLAMAAVFIAALILRWNQFVPPDTSLRGIVDERAYYPSDRIVKMRTDGQKLKKYLHGLDVTVGFYGARAAMVYYSDLPVAIECDAGLTDEYIAHLPLESRGRPGHEKHAPPDYLQKRGVNFIIPATIEAGNPYDSLTLISLGGLAAQTWIYDRKIMDKLARIPEVVFIDFTAYLDQYINSNPDRKSRQFLRDLEFFKQYYFFCNNDLPRWNLLTAD